MEIGFPSAHHEEEIVLSSADPRRDLEQALTELGWHSVDAEENGHYHQFFRPDHTWWKNRWMDGEIVLVSDRVHVRIAKFVLGDVVDWTDECKKLVDIFRAKLLDVAGRPRG